MSLVENIASGRHRRGTLGASSGFFGEPSGKYRGTQRLGRGAIYARCGSPCSEIKMVLLSRSFIRKRAIWLATTASVAAASLVMAHGPSSADRICTTTPIHYIGDWQNSSDEAPFLAENQSALTKMIADMAVE